MKKVFCLLIILVLASYTNVNASLYSSAKTNYAMNARNVVRYYPQRPYSRRFRRQPNYLYSPQQARYYGYRIPQNNMYGNTNPYYRNYNRY